MPEGGRYHLKGTNTMKVEPASADLHVHMTEAFGLPTPSSAEYKEVFGWYHCGDGREEGPKYWVYDPATETWDVNKGEPERATFARGDWSPADVRLAQEKYDQLRMMAPPPIPANTDACSTTTQFLYEGWLFAWHFFPELRRWELAPIRKL